MTGLMRVPARLPACDLPAQIGGMLFADGTVEVQCTPLGAVAAVDKGICGVLGNQSPMAPERTCVFGIVDEVVYFDEGGTDEGRARLVVALRAGLGRPAGVAHEAEPSGRREPGLPRWRGGGPSGTTEPGSKGRRERFGGRK